MTDGRHLAEVRNAREMQQAFRQRAEQLCVSRRTLDEEGLLAPGYSAKLLCDPPLRGLGITSMWALLGVLGLKIVLVVDERRHVLPKRVATCPTESHWRNERALLKAFSIVQEWGRKGGQVSGLARMTKLTAKQRSAIARKAIRARWRKAKST